ncbi:unnamed protein product [Cochlearia groenlandica]
MGNQKLKWTEEEEEALLAGVRKHGPSKWQSILRDPEFTVVLRNRTNVDLKDKWRNLSVPFSIQGSKDKVRTPKIKAAAFQLAADAAAITITQPPSNKSSLVALPHSSGPSDMIINDNTNSEVEPKNVPRYDGMIFEALSSLGDPNGSDVSAILGFIEQRYEVPLKRTISSRLIRLAAQGKLLKEQNSYKMKDCSLAKRTPPAARSKEISVKHRQKNSQVPSASRELLAQASKTVAFKLVEVEKEVDMCIRSLEEVERLKKLAEHADNILLIAEEMHRECCMGKMVELA